MAELRIDTERNHDQGEGRSEDGRSEDGAGEDGAGGDGVTVRVAGEVDLDTADQLTAGLEACHGMVVVDLAGVTFMDSSGLATLIRARNRLTSEGGQLLVRETSENVRRLFEVTGLTELLES